MQGFTRKFIKFFHFANVLYTFLTIPPCKILSVPVNFQLDFEYLLKRAGDLFEVFFFYLREINIRDYREKYSYDGKSQPYASKNLQYLLICLCDLL